MEPNDLTIALTYWFNGLCAVLYWLVDHWPALAGLAVAVLSAWLIDRPAAKLAGGRSRRYERGTINLAGAPAYMNGILTPALLWFAASWLLPPPVPYEGLAMWLGALIVPLSLPIGKRHLAHRLRWFIAIYAAMGLGFWVLARYPLTFSQAAAWSERLQAAGAGEALEWSVRAQFVPYLVLLLWVIYPLTYFGYLAQQLAVQRRLLIAPWKSVTQIMAESRARGEM